MEKSRASYAKLVENAFEHKLAELLKPGADDEALVAGLIATQTAGTTQATLAADVAENHQLKGIDKSVLAVSEPRRYRNRAHLRFVAAQACVICGRKPSDPHHLRFMQPRALGRKVSDEFAVPLCSGDHRALHRSGDEQLWWAKARIDPVKVARKLWKQSRQNGRAVRATDIDRNSWDGKQPLVPADRAQEHC